MWDLLTEINAMLERENAIPLYLPDHHGGNRIFRVPKSRIVTLTLERPNDPMGSYIKNRPRGFEMTEEDLTEAGKNIWKSPLTEVMLVKRLDGSYHLLKNAFGKAPIFLPYDPTRVRLV